LCSRKPPLLHSPTVRTLIPAARSPPSPLASHFPKTLPSSQALRSHTPPRPPIPPRPLVRPLPHRRHRHPLKRLPMRTGQDSSRSLRLNRAPSRLLLSLMATLQYPLRNRRPSPQQLLPRSFPLKNQSPLTVNLRTRRGPSGNQLVPINYPFLSQCFSLFTRIFVLLSSFLFPLLICPLRTILPSTLPAGSLCMYVLITDAGFHCIRSSLQHTSLTLVYPFLFFVSSWD